NVTIQAASLAGAVLTPDFTISATPASQSAVPGGSAPYTVSIGAVNGFAGNVALSVSGLPAGVTAGFSPATVTGGGSSTMTLATTAVTAAGSYPLTITAASGTAAHTGNVTLVVTVPAGGGTVTGAFGAPVGPVQLTTEGTSD